MSSIPSLPKKSAKVTILSVLLSVSILVVVILAVFCVRQHNLLRYKSIVNLSTAYSYMQDFYLTKDDSHKESFSKILLAMESQSDYLDNTALKVKEFVRLSALSATQDDTFNDVSAIVRSVDVNFDTENKTVIVDLDALPCLFLTLQEQFFFTIKMPPHEVNPHEGALLFRR